MNMFSDFYKEKEAAIMGWGFILLFLVVWEFIPSVVRLPEALSLFFTTPYRIAIALYKLTAAGELQQHLFLSATGFLLGLAIACSVGLPVGIIMGRSRWINAMLDPFITAFNATPRLVFIPLVQLWFGLGIQAVVVIVFIGALLPLLINTCEGVKNADRVLINVVRSFGAGEWQIMRMVILPNSLPYIIAGLRLAIGRAILGVVVAEIFAGGRGVGALMEASAQNYSVDKVFVGLILFMGISLALTMSVKKLEYRLSRWRPEEVKSF